MGTGEDPAAERHPYDFSVFKFANRTENRKPVWVNEKGRFLFCDDFGAWLVGPNPSKNKGSLRTSRYGLSTPFTEDNNCIWQYGEGSSTWHEDDSIKVECLYSEL